MDDLADRISGTWHNEVDSEFSLVADRSGRLSGTILSGVGDQLDQRPLIGFYDPAPSGRDAVLGFVVC